MSVVSNLFKPAPTTAAEKLAAQQQIVRDCIAQDAELAPKASNYTREQQEAAAKDAEVNALGKRLEQVVACEELNKPAAEDRGALEKAVAAALAEATRLRGRAGVATAGLAMLDQDRKAILKRRQAAQEPIQQLIADVLHAKLAALAPATFAASDAVTDTLVETFATAVAYEMAAPPGNPHLLEGRSILDLQLPIPKHEAFTSRNTKRNIGREVAQRAEAILAELQKS